VCYGTAMPTPDADENAAFNKAVHKIMDTGDSLGEPGCSGPELPVEDLVAALRLIWRHLGGEVTPNWREEMNAERAAYAQRNTR